MGRDQKPADLEPQRELLTSYGLRPQALKQRTRHQRRLLRRRVLAAAVLSMLRMASDLRQLHGPQTAPAIVDPEGPGFHLYLATTDLAGIWLALTQLALWQTNHFQCWDPEEEEDQDALDAVQALHV
jgi:hypothetical protein